MGERLYEDTVQKIFNQAFTTKPFMHKIYQALQEWQSSVNNLINAERQIMNFGNGMLTRELASLKSSTEDMQFPGIGTGPQLSSGPGRF